MGRRMRALRYPERFGAVWAPATIAKAKKSKLVDYAKAIMNKATTEIADDTDMETPDTSPDEVVE